MADPHDDCLPGRCGPHRMGDATDPCLLSMRDLDEIAAALAAKALAEVTLHKKVTIARVNGHSWTKIAKVLGVTKQAARERFGVR